MKIINADIAELMFDITPEELIEKTIEAISCGGYPEENRFNTSDYLDLEPNYSFSIFPVVIKNIKANDILSVEALNNEEIKVKINFSKKYVHSQLLYLVSRKKIAEHTISIVFKRVNIIGSRYETKIILDDLDLKNLKNTHAILEAAKKEQFKNISEIDFINIIIGKYKKGEPILVHDSDLEKNARLNTIKKTGKKLRFLSSTGLLSRCINKSKIVYNLTNKAMELVGSEESYIELDFSIYNKQMI